MNLEGQVASWYNIILPFEGVSCADLIGCMAQCVIAAAGPCKDGRSNVFNL